MSSSPLTRGLRSSWDLAVHNVISDANAYPREQFHEYLRSLMRANLGDRLMFGSDAAGPGALGPSIEGITSAAFLNDREKRAILCENAARFFRLTPRPGR